MKRTPFKRKPYSLKRTPLKRGTVMLKRSGFNRKAIKPLKKTKLSKDGHSPTSILKKKIQAVLRSIVILRDGGCILRNYKDKIIDKYQSCGGYTASGNLILQAEHLNSRSNMRSFSDERLVVCLCLRHHAYYKTQYPEEYYSIIKEHLGPENTKLLESVQANKTPFKIDLEQELKRLVELGFNLLK